MVAAVLLFDGKQNEMTFEDMNAEETFPRLVELIETVEKLDVALHRLLLQLMYEMSRIQRIKVAELSMGALVQIYCHLPRKRHQLKALEEDSWLTQ